MTHTLLTLGVAAGLATPAAAQWLGEPLWNSVTGGGFTISADYGKPNDNYGSGSAWGARLSLGYRAATFTAGAANWRPGGGGPSLTSVGGNVAVRLSGGPLLPTPSPGLRANLQVGFGHTEVANQIFAPASETMVTGAVGLGARLPAPGFSVEPYVSPGVRYRSYSGGTSSTEFGYAIGANITFRSFGAHFAYDGETTKGGPSVGVFGVGVHVAP